MKNKFRYSILALPAVVIFGVLLYFTPPVHSRLAWRIDEWVLRFKYRMNPPEEVVFVPQSSTSLPPPVLYTATPAVTSTPVAPAIEAGPTHTPAPSPTPKPTTTPLPEKVSLKGVRYEDQHGRLNYCAPANLAMALSYWGWEGDRDVVGPVLKPDPKDKNVMPYEMVDYVQNETSLGAIERVGGDLDTIKRFLSAGYPILVEKGAYFHDLSGVKSWMGHYQVITGYDDAAGELTVQDSFVSSDLKVTYESLEGGWRAFNDTYIITYPLERETEIMELLGPDADVTANVQRAAQKASDEIYSLSGIDQYFAWFNRGTNLRLLQDYAGAAQAYDQAFQIYPTIPEAQRPWRMLWYQTGPYFAYFYSGRYWDTLNLAETTLSAMQSDKNLEESYYWRAMAKAALGDTAGAIKDFQSALQYHPGFEPAIYQLEQLGVSAP